MALVGASTINGTAAVQISIDIPDSAQHDYSVL